MSGLSPLPCPFRHSRLPSICLLSAAPLQAMRSNEPDRRGVDQQRPEEIPMQGMECKTPEKHDQKPQRSDSHRAGHQEEQRRRDLESADDEGMPPASGESLAPPGIQHGVEALDEDH